MSVESGGVETLHLGTVSDVIGALRLERVQFYELSATAGDEADQDGGPERPPAGDVTFETSMRVRETGADFRCSVTVPLPGAQIKVDAAAIYDAGQKIDVEVPVLFEYGTNVAFMVLFPYLRQAAYDLALRVGRPLHLPMLRRGVITFGPDPDAGAEADGE